MCWYSCFLIFGKKCSENICGKRLKTGRLRKLDVYYSCSKKCMLFIISQVWDTYMKFVHAVCVIHGPCRGEQCNCVFER